MSRALIVHRAGPGVTVQDRGRPGHLAMGLSRGGAADRLALEEGAALLGQRGSEAALEMSGMGGVFEATGDMRIALTGAQMRADIDGTAIAWNASHLLPAGARLTVGAVTWGVYGYLHLGGGVAVPERLGARSAHLAAGIGAPLSAGDRLPIGPDDGSATGLLLTAEPRFDGGSVRVVQSLQTAFFDDATLARFQATAFTRDSRGNRMGVRLVPDGAAFRTDAGLNILSEVIVPGDIQITGDGAPFVLLAECQTTGGYPRIGSVLPCDLPRIVQAQAGAMLRFRFVSLDDAVAAERQAEAARSALRRGLRPLIRDPRDMDDLLSCQLIGGVTAGDDLDGSGP